MKRAPNKDDLSAETVQLLFSYDAATGVLRHKRRHGVIEGATAGTTNNRGYISVKVHQRSYLGHRVVWLIVTGVWPSKEIDHINGDKKDNRFCNLREASRRENVANAGARRGGLKGAYWNKTLMKWHSHIRDDGRLRHLGWFDTEELAHVAYVDAARTVFGEFAHG